MTIQSIENTSQSLTNQGYIGNISGRHNTANGVGALYSNTTANNNTANGIVALYYNTTGTGNAANGYYALYNNATGSGNTANGYEALKSNTTGNYNTAIGDGADVSTGDLTNATAIGANAQVSQDSSLVLGDAANVGIGTSTPDAKLHVVGRARIDGDRLEFVNTGNSVFIGAGAGVNDDFTDNENTAVGDSALFSNTTGHRNTANGYQSLSSNTTGDDNTANGYQALRFNTAFRNTGIGYQSLFSNTGGYNNTANGYRALYSNTTGYSNTANGFQGLYFNTTGYFNTANGYRALYNNTTGHLNTANGWQALNSNTTGHYNTANGNGALYTNTTGNYNTVLGTGADVSTGDLTNATAIGANAEVSQDSSLVLGDAANVGIGTSAPDEKLHVVGNIKVDSVLASVLDITGEVKFLSGDKDIVFSKDNFGNGQTTDLIFNSGDVGFNQSEFVLFNQNDNTIGQRYFQLQFTADGGGLTIEKGGDLGIGTTTPGYKLQVGESGDGTQARANAWNTFSDRRWKRDFQSIANPLEKLDSLNGYYYYWKINAKDQSRQLGVIAQEVESVFPEIVSTDAEGYKSVDYSKLSAFLIEVNKAQQTEIEALQSENSNLKTQNSAFENRLSKIEATIQILSGENAHIK